MAELIDREALKEALLERGFYTIIVKHALEKAPTVDAVEVIHCHECLGKSTWINDPKYGCTVCNMSGMYPKNENGYCSYAIRKGDKK